MKQIYKINTGIDTLFKSGIRTSLEITNRDNFDDTELLIKKAAVEYSNARFFLQAAISDYGYGNDFFLYNRSYDDLYYNENVLLNCKWHGLTAGYISGSNSYQFGIGGNDVNWLLGELAYKHDSEYKKARVFMQYNLRDSFYSVMDFDAGAEIIYNNNRFKLQSGFDYNYIPVSSNFPEITNWHLINEFSYFLKPQLSMILSAELQTRDKSEKVWSRYEGCLNFSIDHTQFYAGVKKQDILSNKMLNPFLNINYNIREKFTAGLCLDLFRIMHEDSYYKVGLQTSYTLD